MARRLPEGFRDIYGEGIGEKYPHKELTARVIGGAIAVHRKLGTGFQESIYENALVVELAKAGLSVAQQVAYSVYYDGVLVGEHRADVVVENLIVVELKAVSELTSQHTGQVMSTLKAASLRLGLLMNFHETRLVDGLRRIIVD